MLWHASGLQQQQQPSLAASCFAAHSSFSTQLLLLLCL
jgi:hypothetical protein